jgi:hypothetical protein
VDRARNKEVDALAKEAARGETLPSDVFYHVIGTPADRNPEGLQVTNDTEGHHIVNLIMTEDWRAPITLFLQGYYHPSDVNEAKRLKHRSRDFILVGDQSTKAKMRHRNQRHSDPTRSPQRNLRLPLKAQGPRCQGDPSRILLARDNLRRKSSHAVVRSLPKVFSPLGQPFAVHKADRPHMATSMLGAGYCRTTTYGSREPQVHLRCRRILHKMDRGQGSIHDNIEDRLEVLLAKHCLLIWSPVRAHSRQWQTV